MEHARTTLVRVNWWEFVQQKARGESRAEIGRKVNVAPQTVGRWNPAHATHAKPEPGTVVRFARAYDADIVEAFVAAGIFSEEEAGRKIDQPDPRELTDDELLSEVARRIGRPGKVAKAADGRTARGGRSKSGSVAGRSRSTSNDVQELPENAAGGQDHPLGSPEEKTGSVSRERHHRGDGNVRESQGRGRRGTD